MPSEGKGKRFESSQARIPERKVQMSRAIIIVLDSLGIGSSPDSIKYNDNGSNTLGHIAQKFSLRIPYLTSMGMVKALEAASNNDFGLPNSPVIAAYGYCQEVSKGKDTVSGHWEMAGCPVLFDWGYFTNLTNSFPSELLDNIVKKANLPGFLGNCHASGTEIIQRLGEEHIATKKPIFYTSADSVFQIAAHEEYFGLDNLYTLCEIARKEVDLYNIGRVIARPFIGTNAKDFNRTHNRKDYTTPPFAKTLLDIAKENNIQVIAIGKTGDIFAHQGINTYLKSPGNQGGIEDTIKALKEYTSDCLIFTNLCDFDMLYGHRRNPQGYGEAINYFDQRLPEILNLLQPDDLLIITADHGNDPTWHGTDHTRELIPLLVYKPKGKANSLGKRTTFADIGQTMAEHLKLPKLDHGNSFYSSL